MTFDSISFVKDFYSGRYKSIAALLRNINTDKMLLKQHHIIKFQNSSCAAAAAFDLNWAAPSSPGYQDNLEGHFYIEARPRNFSLDTHISRLLIKD